MKKIKEWRNKNEFIFNIIVLIIFVLGSGYIALHHESCSDEAQAWLISRDLSLVDIFKEMKYEGHSILWNLVLIPFIKLGFPYEYFSLISCFIIDISVYIILFKINTSKLIKALIIFSEPYIYFYSSIARCYCLIPLFISILIMLEQNKEKNIYLHAITLAFLANVHVIMIPIVIVLLVVNYIPYIREYKIRKDRNSLKKYIIAGLIVIFGIMIFIIQIIDMKCMVIIERLKLRLDFNFFIVMLIDTLRNICFYIFPNTISIILFIILGLLIIIVAKYYKRQALIFFASLLNIIVVNYKVNWGSSIQRSQIIIIILFYIVVDIYKNRIENIPKYINKISIGIYIVICISSTIDTLPSIKGEISLNYSSAKETMEYINSSYKDGKTICCFTFYFISTSLVPYAQNEYEFFDLINDRNFTYYHWDVGTFEYVKIYMDKVVEKLEEKIINHNSVVLVVSNDMNYLVNFIEGYFNVELKFKSDFIFYTKNKLCEEYFVYEVKRINNLLY